MGKEKNVPLPKHIKKAKREEIGIEDWVIQNLNIMDIVVEGAVNIITDQEASGGGMDDLACGLIHAFANLKDSIKRLLDIE